MAALRSSDITLHRCDYCKSEFRWAFRPVLLGQLKVGAKGGCPRFRIALACADWAGKNVKPLAPVICATLYKSGCVSIEYEHRRFEELQISRLHRESSTLFSLDQDLDLRILPQATSSEKTFTVLRNWLDQCLHHHPMCASHREVHPHGALDGIRFLQLTENTATLIDHEVPRRYACLSHCWGSGQQIPETTTGNVENRKASGIPLLELPRTFQDAVNTCLRLGIEHIWIDCICIIQDDLKDWEHHAACMADIYENCILTIAATAASNPSDGCFSQADSAFIGEPLPGSEDLHVRRMTPLPTEIFPDRRLWPALRRAWIYQELCLSPRVVHFGAHEILWQCRTVEKRQSTSKYISGFESYKHPVTLSDRGGESLQHAWYRYVQTYSVKGLTYIKDRLPAIAAIAGRILKLRPDDRYLAGLWRSTLLHDLLWISQSSDRTSTNYSIQSAGEAPARVPTWSWARTGNGVWWGTPLAGEKFANVHLLDAVCITEGSPMSGLVKEAYIRLRAPLIELRHLRTAHYCKDSIKGRDDWWDLHLACVDDVQAPPDAPSWHELTIVECIWDDYGLVGDGNIGNGDILALPLIKEPMGMDGLLTVLLVRRKGEDQVYERLGTSSVQLFGGYFARFLWNSPDACQKMAIGEQEQVPVSEDVAQSAERRYSKSLCRLIEGMDTRVITLV